ncbi:MAG TPA: hypothetical protein PLD23_12500 [Armatimonadota bacterium]|nr:hypothetical protein [Armatimonadota bacterium]HQK94323.1 hypothetical protein [Armatimonadota bacterium]
MDEYPVKSTRWAAPGKPVVIEIRATAKYTDEKTRYGGEELDGLMSRGVRVPLPGIGEDWGRVCEGIHARKRTRRSRAGEAVYDEMVTHLRIGESATPVVVLLREVLAIDYDYDREGVHESGRYSISVEGRPKTPSG